MKNILFTIHIKCRLVLILLIAGQCPHAQFIVTGKITDSIYRPVSNCNVLLLALKDSSLVKGTLSSAAGTFSLNNISSGHYLISCSSAGFETIYKIMEVANDAANAGTIILYHSIQQLSTVTVTVKKPLFEQKIDRMVVNVKNSITSAGGTVLDVLEKSPGVMVNRQGGSISMTGKEGVQVMINGKLSYMPADALLTMLDGMSANNVERIELITTPPAKYDAGGNAGYINIVMSQNPNEGFNGTYSVTAAAFHGSSPAANFDFNYRVRKSNLYGGYTFSRRAQIQEFNNYRKVIYQNKTTETSVSSERDPSQTNHGLRLGYDYQLSKNTTFGILASCYNNMWKMDAVNSSVTTINTITDSSIHIENKEKNHWQHGMGNINLQHNFTGGDISFNADYLYYDDYNPNEYTDKYYDGNGAFLSTQQLRSSKKTIIHIFPVQVDYHKKINNIDFETGVKSVFTKFTNNVLVAKLEQNVWNPDMEFTGNYLLKENIAAAYTSVSFNAGAANTIKAGLRYEYTYSNLGSETKKDIVNRKYGYLFPTVYLSHKINDNNTVNFSYNRRINRPSFNDLAPFLIFIDPNTFLSGNAALQPAISDGIKIDYMLKHFIFSLAYTYESSTIGNFQVDVNTATNKQYITAQNLEFTKNVSATFSLPFSPASWWTSQINLVGIWQQAEASYLKDPIDVSVFNYNISGFQSFTLPKSYSIELSGFYQSKGLFGVAKTNGFGLINFGAQKKFSNANCTFRFGVDDIFSSLKFVFSTDVPEQQFYTNGTLQFRRRIFKFTFTKNFGNKILKEKRERQTASDAERQRVTQ